ncbi:hypothetical protein [Candidatus Phytoplasma pini]|uniref:Uncharacterized protein n=1 Tax=Candidatus Phytoplasma pini TaxID=267362 RepID=A0A559KJ07_9MOLU|nr:hypothetical protein [Candidatus Phytoplasma pini]TVY12115.1 hypothetical protein MDPP_00327 [Candidatus Phytoplasma pini]
MRIIPYELYKYAPDFSLCALRKEFGIYNYCLNKQKTNKAMQPFLNMGFDYFHLSFDEWIKEMKKRKHYINSFHLFYADRHTYPKIKTDFFLILECCIQWELKNFISYQNYLSWFEITNKIFKDRNNYSLYQFNSGIYKKLMFWYQKKFMTKNKNNNLKPKKLNMEIVFENFHNIFKNYNQL